MRELQNSGNVPDFPFLRFVPETPVALFGIIGFVIGSRQHRKDYVNDVLTRQSIDVLAGSPGKSPGSVSSHQRKIHKNFEF
ncbi:MAG: hypothetical protein HW380_3789 [Magnetococcales bacterium]|nr:hypothetical protein [Magnetococcales bacterium]